MSRLAMPTPPPGFEPETDSPPRTPSPAMKMSSPTPPPGFEPETMVAPAPSMPHIPTPPPGFIPESPNVVPIGPAPELGPSLTPHPDYGSPEHIAQIRATTPGAASIGPTSEAERVAAAPNVPSTHEQHPKWMIDAQAELNEMNDAYGPGHTPAQMQRSGQLMDAIRTRTPPPTAVVQDQDPQNTLGQDLKNVPANVGAAEARGIGGVVGAAGTLLRKPGEIVRSMGRMFPGVNSPISVPDQEPGKFLQRQGGYLTAGAGLVEQEQPVQGEVGKLAVGVGTLGVDAGAAALTGGAGFTASFAGRNAGTMYSNALAQGDSPDVALQKGVVAGFTAAITPQIAHILPPHAGQAIAEQVAKAYIGTGSMVAAQAVIDAATLTAGTGRSIDLSQVFPEAASQGLIGVLMHHGFTVLARHQHPIADESGTADISQAQRTETPPLKAGDYGEAFGKPPAPTPPPGFVPETEASNAKSPSPVAEVAPPPAPDAQVEAPAVDRPVAGDAAGGEGRAVDQPTPPPGFIPETVAASPKAESPKLEKAPPEADHRQEGTTGDRGTENAAVAAHPESVPAEPDTGDVAGMYAGEKSTESLPTAERNRRKANLDTAKMMADAGADAEKVRLATGWFKGESDGKWRYEIDDSAMKFKNIDAPTLGEAVDHPALFKAYPELAKTPLRLQDNLGVQGEFRGLDRGIVMDSYAAEPKKTLLHEIQHAVQATEGFARGANASEAGYRQSPGEVEARSTAERANLPAKQREVSPDISEAPSHAFAQPKTMAGAGKTDVTSLDLAKQVEKVTGTPVRTGHGMFGQRKAAGWFNRSTDIIRNRTSEALDVAYHEAGHSIHDKVIGWKTPWPSGVATELQKMGRELYGNRTPNAGYRREGMAEYVARDLLGDDMTKAAPLTHDWFTKTVLPAHPEFAKEYAKLQQMAKAWDDQGAVARVAGKIHELDTGIPGKLKTAYEKISKILSPYAWTNDAHHLEKAQKKLLEQRGINRADLPPVMDPAKIRQALKMTAPGTAKFFIEDGAVNNRYDKIGPSLKDALEPVKDDLGKFVTYAYARRAELLHGKGINPGISKEDAAYTVKALETPKFKAASDAITTWSGHLIDYLVEAGALSQEAADVIRAANPVYLPLKRFFDENQLGGSKGSRKGMVNQGGAVQKIKGSGRSIIDPLESLALQAEHMITLGNKARVARSIVDLAEVAGRAGWFAEKVDLEQQGQAFSVADVKKQLEGLGADLSQVDLDKMLTVFSQPTKYAGKDNIVTIWRNGKREFWELHPDVYRAVTEMDKDQVPAFLRFLSTPARIVRVGATALRPAFQLTNMIKDAFTASVLGKGMRTPLASIRGIAADWAGKPEAERWKAAGGGMTTIMGQDRAAARRTLEESLASGVKERTIMAAKHPVDAVRALFEAGESGPRIEEFRRAYADAQKKYGAGTESAALAALLSSKEITVDFTRQGMVGAIANQFIPFFNARLQGTSRLYRVLADPKTALPAMAKALTWITIPSVALWYSHKDEEWWQELPDYERSNNWHFSFDGGKTIRKVPVPESIGKLFGSTPVAAIDAAYRKDPKTVSDSVFELVKSLLPVSSPMEALSAYAKPAIEASANYDSYKGRPIVPQYMTERKIPSEQYQKWTTETAKSVGKWLNVSPLKVEHLISGYTGGLGLDLARWAESMAGIRKPQPGETPIASRFSTKSPIGRGETVERFYNRIRDLKQKAGSDSLQDGEAGELARLNARAQAISVYRKQMESGDLSEEEGYRQIQDMVKDE